MDKSSASSAPLLEPISRRLGERILDLRALTWIETAVSNRGAQVPRELFRPPLAHLLPDRPTNVAVGGDEKDGVLVAVLRCQALDQVVGRGREAHLERPTPLVGSDAVEDDDAARALEGDEARKAVDELGAIAELARMQDVVPVEEIEHL